MKITALGVNSAFATGGYRDVIDLDRLNSLLDYETGLHIDVDFKSRVKELVTRAYVPKWQSNFLIEFETKGKVKDNIYRLVIDFGGDIRHSLANAGLKLSDIDGWYCSHPHADHVGGIEGIALSTFFNPFYVTGKKDWCDTHNLFDCANELPQEYKPDLFAHRNVIDELWRAAAPGLETLQGVMDVKLETYFTVHQMIDNKLYSMKDGDRTWKFYTIVSTHVVSGTKLMPSYGLMIEGSDGKKIYMPTDTQFMAPPQIETFYRRADVIYQDCETGFRSGVHAYIDDLKTLAPDVKKKLYLYHFTEEPTVEKGEFKGILKTGECHVY